MRMHEILSEGGWASTLTQSTKLTPAVVAGVVPYYHKFVNEFNQYLKTQNAPPVAGGHFIGSTAYYQRDLENEPDKEYGDIDALLEIPRVKELPESKNELMYKKLILQFLDKKRPPYIEVEHALAEQDATHLIFKVDENYLQVDLIFGFAELGDWVQYRLTPEHNLKGRVLAQIYTALSSLLNLSISTRGVQTKLVGGELVPFSSRKIDKLETISSDIGTFMIDILEYLYRQMGGRGKAKVAPLLLQNPGLDRKEILFTTLLNSVKGLAESFELNRMYGKGVLAPYSNKEEFLAGIVNVYTKNMKVAIASSKFDKAETPEAKATAEATKEKFRKGIQMVAKALGK